MLTRYRLFKSFLLFLFNDTATTDIYTLSLHDALPICMNTSFIVSLPDGSHTITVWAVDAAGNNVSRFVTFRGIDRKSTRLNSSHVRISYAVFCLKKKNHTYAIYV